MSVSWKATAAASASSLEASALRAGPARGTSRVGSFARRAPRPELAGLIVLAVALNLWALSGNGWANGYYSAAVRSMSSSWHNFLFASLDTSGVMSVDKPPLALWVQALSVRAFGFHQLSVLVPQALEGVASVVLVYDLVRRRFGRAGGSLAGAALALTPVTVAISRHNNPDALLVLCCVAALWCAVRALEDGSTRWLVLSGVCVGLGFETKMAVAFVVVPGIALAWLWVTPAGRGRLHALRRLIVAGAAMIAVGGVWPAIVELTPASQRPWVAGTSDNSVLSLIFGYNGLGRVQGQAGGAGGGGSLFGSSPGPLRLFSQALGGQGSWLLAFALLGALALLVSCRLRRADARSGWLIAVGGSMLVTAVLFSVASGIFHPYYVSLLAPFIAASAGAAAAQLIDGSIPARVLGPATVLAGVVGELVVRARYAGELSWLVVPLIAVAVLASLALVFAASPRVRAVAVAAAFAALLIAPGVWALDTLGHASSGTFPAGGPASIGAAAPGQFAGRRPRPGARGATGPAPFGRRSGTGPAGIAAGALTPGAAGGGPGGVAAGFAGPAPPSVAGAALGRGGAPGGGPFAGDAGIARVLAYAGAHGGGTVAVASQSSAAAAIIAGKLDVAGIGGFSGRESSVSVSWLAGEVSRAKLRWVLAEQGNGGFARPPGDNRTGSSRALTAVASACRRVTLATAPAGRAASPVTFYDCRGRAAALLGAGRASRA